MGPWKAKRTDTACFLVHHHRTQVFRKAHSQASGTEQTLRDYSNSNTQGQKSPWRGKNLKVSNGQYSTFRLAFKVLISWELVSRGARKSSFEGGCFLSAAILGKEQPTRMHRKWWLRRPGHVETKGKWEAKVCVETRNVMPWKPSPWIRTQFQSSHVTPKILTACYWQSPPIRLIFCFN